MLHYFKNKIENIFGLKIYRNSLPKGLDPVDEIYKLSTHYGIKIKILFDVGANTGQSTISFKNYFPHLHIHCFEPIHNTFKFLKSETSRFRNVYYHQFALGSASDEVTINTGERNDLFSLVEPSQAGNVEVIKVRTIDKVIKKLGIDKIDILKIDTEGYDLEVLKGAKKILSQGDVEFIQVETKLNGTEKRFVHLNEFINYLTPFGYELMSICNQEGWNIRSPLVYCNALFQKNRDWYG